MHNLVKMGIKHIPIIHKHYTWNTNSTHMLQAFTWIKPLNKKWNCRLSNQPDQKWNNMTGKKDYQFIYNQ